MCHVAWVSFSLSRAASGVQQLSSATMAQEERSQADDMPWGCCCAGNSCEAPSDRPKGGQRLCPPCPCIQTPYSYLASISTTGACRGGLRLHNSRSPDLPLQPMSNPCLLLWHSLSRFCLFIVHVQACCGASRASGLQEQALPLCTLHTYCSGRAEDSRGAWQCQGLLRQPAGAEPGGWLCYRRGLWCACTSCKHAPLHCLNARRATPLPCAEQQQTLQVFFSPSSRPSWFGRTTTSLGRAAAVSRWVLRRRRSCCA